MAEIQAAGALKFRWQRSLRVATAIHMSELPVHKLFVTLIRSYAGTKKAQKAILKDLGFSYRLQTLERPNNLHIRGALDKVSNASCTKAFVTHLYISQTKSNAT